MQEYINHIDQSLFFGGKEVSKLTIDIIDIKGLTSKKVKSFLNNLCGLSNASYLEIGAYKGATFCSAIYGNNLYATAIDNWKQFELLPSNFSLWSSIDNKKIEKDPQNMFLHNVKKCGDISKIKIINKNYINLTSADVSKKVNVVFYDGEHIFKDQYVIMSKLKDITEEIFILVVDDWNWEKRGIFKGMEDFKFKCLYKKEIFTKLEDPNDFWNGLGIFLLYNKHD